WIEAHDLNVLREDVSAIDVAEIVDPLPISGAGTNPISAAMTRLVGIDFYDLESEVSETEDASLIAKLNKNRVWFAAFAFVFTIVTVRMNSTDSKREKLGFAQHEKRSRIGS